MKKTNATIASIKGTSTLVRAKFGPGMLLQHEDLDQLNSYTRDLSRLLFKSFFGCGVICGLAVKVDPKCGKMCLTVGAGLALACSGDPVYVPKDQTFALDENCDPSLDGPLWVVLCGTVRQCAPRTAICASDDDEAPAEPTRERDGFEIRVVRGDEPPQCACGCAEPSRTPSSTSGSPPPVMIAKQQPGGEDHCQCADPKSACYQDHYNGTCGCNCDECSDEDCKCILLAKLIKNDDDKSPWLVDHRVRRFIRPVLMRDPQAEEPGSQTSTDKARHILDEALVAQNLRGAYKVAADAATAADKATDRANETAAVHLDTIAAARAAADRANRAQAVADNAKVAADNAAPGDKAAAGKATKAAAEASKTAELAREAAAKVEETAAEAYAAELEARKAAEEKAVADQAFVAAADKQLQSQRNRPQSLRREETPPTDR